MKLDNNQRRAVKTFAIQQALSRVFKPLLHHIGDRMETSRVKLFRETVRFFRG